MYNSSVEALPDKATGYHEALFSSDLMEIMLYSCDNTYAALENVVHEEVALKRGKWNSLSAKGNFAIMRVDMKFVFCLAQAKWGELSTAIQSSLWIF